MTNGDPSGWTFLSNPHSYGGFLYYYLFLTLFYSFDSPFRQLTGVGAKALLPTGGFYIFPDFEVIRESLKKRGVTTSEELVQTMFDESSVSVSNGQVC